MAARRRRERDDANPVDAARPAAEIDRLDPVLEGLLEEVRDLRLTLAADLSLAASAVEAGAPAVASDVVDADRRELASFARLADARLRRLQDAGEVVPVTGSRWRRRVAVAIPAVPLVGALAVSAAAATGALPLPGDSGPRQQVTTVETVATPGAPVATTFRQFESVVDSDASASQVVAAAAKLHQQLAALMASTPDDPARARVVANLLQLEQDLLLRKQPPGTSIVLAASRRLVAQLLGSSAGSSPANVHPSPTTVLLPTVAPTYSHPTSSPAPTHTRAPSSSPKPKQTSSPTPAPASSPSDDPGSHLPHIGA